MSTQPFVAEIMIFCGNFAPLGWAFCDGQLLPIMQNTALFSLIGTTFGGDGQTNFALPNLQGCAALNFGEGPGLTGRDMGETGGAAAVTLTASQMPAHTHGLQCAAGPGDSFSPAGSTFAADGTQTIAPYGAPPGNANMAPVSAAGNSQPHNNLPPFLGVNFIIALQGVFPARS